MNHQDIALAFVGTVVPDYRDFQNRAFSRAGNMFQENFLQAISTAGLPPTLIVSQRPIRSFPRSNALFIPGQTCHLSNGRTVKLVSFVNILVLRVFTVALAIIFELVKWAWDNRNAKQKVVIIYNLTEPSGFFIWIGAKLIRAKTVVALYDINIPGRTVPDTLARRLDFTLQKFIIPKFDGLLVVSRKIVEDFAPDTAFTWVVGAGTEAFLNSPALSCDNLRNQNNCFVIAFAGMLTEVNGIPELLEAFSLLDDEKDYRLRIAGKGPLETLVREAADRDPDVDFLGYVSFDEVTELYRSADVLINMRIVKRIRTDYFFPSKLLEYMSTGIPTITTPVAHIEQFSDVVFLLREETSWALADKICYVASLDKEKRKQMGEQARTYIRENITWEMQGRRVAEFIKSEVVNA